MQAWGSAPQGKDCRKTTIAAGLFPALPSSSQPIPAPTWSMTNTVEPQAVTGSPTTLATAPVASVTV